MAGTPISRREFLKFLGAGAAAAGLSVFGFNSFFNISKMQNNINNKGGGNGGRASAQTAGSWDSTINQPLQTTTVHAALIEGGKVFWLMGSGNHELNADGPYYHGIWNPDGSFGSTNTVSDDLFCCGLATLANGNVLLCGGTLDYDHQTLNGKFHGGKYAYEANFSSGSVGNRTEMAHGRWYPTCITLPDGKVFVVQGWDEYGCNNRLIEFYDPSSKSWQIKLDPAGNGTYCVGNCATDYYPGQAGSPCYGPGTAPYLSLYPRFHLMPSGLLASVGGELDDRIYDPNTFKWIWSGKTIKRHYGTSVLLPLENVDTEKGKILVCGGSPQAADPATNTAEIATPSGTVGLSRSSVQSMKYARKHIGPVILPTGQIVIFGGNLQTNQSPVLYPEMFDPVTETWTVWPAATVPRMYHQVSLLLQDGRVWTAGTTPDQATKEIRVEVFNPWYISETRPTISGDLTGGAYGNTITIPTPNAADISKVSLIRVSATTHHYNPDQRLIWLQIQGTTASSVTVKAPINNKLAPPGYYLVHILNSAGVPSAGKFIKIPGSADNSPPPPSDTIAPTVALTSPANGATISGPSTGVVINVAGTASDNSGGSGIQKVEVQVGSANQFKLATATGPAGSGDWSTWSASDTVTTEGNHTVTARATDNAGNTKDTTVTVTVAFSGGGGTTYTSIYSVTGANNYAKIYNGNLKRAGEFMQKSATVSSALIGQPVKRVNVILKKSGNPTGTISVVVRRASDDSIVHTFGTIDAPTLTTTTDKTFTLEATSSYTIAANDKILVEWDGTSSTIDQVWVKKSISDTSGLFDGLNTKWTQYITGYAHQGSFDMAGEWFKVSDGNPPPSDTIAPTVALTSPANGATISGPSTGVVINVAGTASDNSGGSGIQKVEVQVGSANQFKLATATGPAGSGDWSTWSASDTVTTEGNHTVTARATDNAGNTKDTTVTVTVAFSGGGGGGTTYTSIYSVAGANNYAKLYTGNLKRAGEFMQASSTVSSALIGQPVKRVNVILKKSRNPTGTISVVVRRASDDSIVHTFGTIDAPTLSGGDKTFTLEATSSYTIAANDKILVEWNGTGTSTNQVWVKTSASNTSGGFDGPNTLSTEYATSYSNQTSYDLAGEWFKLV